MQDAINGINAQLADYRPPLAGAAECLMRRLRIKKAPEFALGLLTLGMEIAEFAEFAELASY